MAPVAEEELNCEAEIAQRPQVPTMIVLVPRHKNKTVLSGVVQVFILNRTDNIAVYLEAGILSQLILC